MEMGKETILFIASKNQNEISDRLEKKYRLLTALTHREAETKINKENIDVVLIDVDSSMVDTLRIIQLIRRTGHRTEILIIGKAATIKHVVKSVQIRVRDCIKKPFTIGHLENKIQRIFDDKDYQNDMSTIREEIGRYYIFENMVGNDEKIRKVFELIKKYSEVNGTVLIQGESGTGKELVAKAIHKRSDRRNSPFVVVNCAAIQKSLMERELFGHTKGAFTGATTSSIGKIETGNYGTIFFDDIDTLDVHMQAKLLRLIQEKEFERIGSPHVIHVDVRFIAATNKDLMEMVDNDAFREDLYYRLNVFPIHLPPLRERKKDICHLLKYFLRLYAKTMGKPMKKFSDNAIQMMNEYDWPGNVRELENVVERLFAITRGGVIRWKDVSSAITKNRKCTEGTLKEKLRRFEKECILKTLEWENGNRKKAARKLGIHRNTLLNKINAFQLKI